MKRLFAIASVCVAVAGCGQNMTSQPKYAEYEPAPLFRSGQVLQQPVAGTVARDDIARADEAANRPPLTRELLARGRGASISTARPVTGESAMAAA